MKTKKKHIVALSGIIVLAFMILLSYVALGDDPVSNIFKKYGDLYKESKNIQSDEILVRVRNKDITIQEFLKYKASSEALNELYQAPAISEEEMISKLIVSNILIIEAEELGVAATYEDAKKYTEDVRRQLNDPDEAEAKSMVTKIMESMNMDEDTYWNEVALPGYQISLTKDNLLAELKKNGELKGGDQSERAFEKNNYEKKLLKKYRKEIQFIGLDEEKKNKVEQIIDKE